MNDETIDPALMTEQEALRHIATLHPSRDSDEGYKEWGEADCFNQAQEIANALLAKLAPADQEKG